MTYIITVGDRAGVFRTFEEKTFEDAKRRYFDCRERFPDKHLSVHNEETYDVDLVDGRYVVDEGLTDEEKEALDGV